MSNARSNIRTLAKRDGRKCHYCRKVVNGVDATRDHVFPRSLGGENSIDNYVLACAGCNHQRGNTLFFCECRRCEEIILDGLYDPETLGRAFDAIVGNIKPTIRRSGRYRPWQVLAGPVTVGFTSFEETIDFLSKNNYCAIEEPDYK